MNKYEANIVLCEEVAGNNIFNNVFNNIVIGGEDNLVSFDIAIFISTMVKEIKEEMLLLDIVAKKEDDERMAIHPIGSTVKKYESLGLKRDLCVFRDNEVDFPWEGEYILELRKTDKIVDTNTITSEEMVSIIEEAEVINTFSFYVEHEN